MQSIKTMVASETQGHSSWRGVSGPSFLGCCRDISGGTGMQRTCRSLNYWGGGWWFSSLAQIFIPRSRPQFTPQLSERVGLVIRANTDGLRWVRLVQYTHYCMPGATATVSRACKQWEMAQIWEPICLCSCGLLCILQRLTQLSEGDGTGDTYLEIRLYHRCL